MINWSTSRNASLELRGNIWDIFGAGLCQDLIRGRWQLHQQYLQAGTGASPFREVTHGP